MSNLTIGPRGEIALPVALRERYGFNPETSIRVIETRTGILLVPLTDAPPIGEDLAKELAEWQASSASAWDMFF